jgi:hypothetical protein
MPLITEQEQSKQSTRWFQPECERDSIRDETEWNLRHIALRSVVSDEWTIKETNGQNWLAEKALGTQQCRILSDDSVLHSKVRPYDFNQIAIPLFDEKTLRTSELRLRAEQLRVEFEALSKKWQRDTRHLSLISKKISHPAYLRIIGMGEPAIPLILEALRDRPAHWFAALRATANTDPSSCEDTPSHARDAWIKWGRSEGHLD